MNAPTYAQIWRVAIRAAALICMAYVAIVTAIVMMDYIARGVTP